MIISNKDITVVNKFPPNIDDIRAVLTLGGKEIFAWNGIIYNPGGGYLTEWLVAHEQVHFLQQAGDPESWWAKYLDDIDFRLEQEIEAHRVEYRTFCKHNRDRNKRARFLFEISHRLASPMYGSALPHAKALKEIKQ